MIKNKKVFYIIVACLVIQCTCRKREDKPPYENISQSLGSSFTPAITVANSGEIYVVWADSTPGNFEIFFAEKNNNGIWSPGLNISRNSFNSVAPHIDVDNTGNIHICWWDFGADTAISRISYRLRKADRTWNKITVLGCISVSDSEYALPRIVCDVNNNVFVVWEGGSFGPNLRYRIKDANGTWSEIMVVPNAPASNPAQLATDLQGNLHLTWEGGNNDILYQMRTATGTWQNLATITQGAPMPLQPDITVNGLGGVHITWSARDSNRNYYVYYTDNSTGTWALPIKLPMKKPDDLGFYSIIDAENDGTLHFIWQNWTKDTAGAYGKADISYVRKYSDGTWSDIHNISNTIGRSICDVGSIVVDDLGNAHLVWADDELGNFEVFYRMIPRDSL